MNEIIYEPANNNFRIFRRNYENKGFFFLTRFLLSLDAEGKKWQENIFCAVIGLLTPSSLALDMFCFCAYYCVIFAYKVALLLMKLILSLIKIIIQNSIGVGLKIAAVALALILLVIKWHEIISFVKNLF